MSDVATFTISLPTCGTLRETVEALDVAQRAQLAQGNIFAAQALSPVISLAKRGLVEFDLRNSPRTFVSAG